MSFKHGTQATVIADSVTPDGVRLTTMEVTFHRFVLAEVNTHRRLSRNSASSRAIPFEKMISRANCHPALYSKWTSEQPGMSGGAELEGDDLRDAMETLEAIRDHTVDMLEAYADRHPDKSTRLHKSLLNRPLEWFMWHTAIISSTEWANMFKQRIDPNAQPEFYDLAYAMREALETNFPALVQYGDLHLPYISDYERELYDPLSLVKISTARCARVSYLTHDGVRDVDQDIRMFDSTLWANGHWSPMEHPAVAVDTAVNGASGNFHAGWHQARWFAEHGNLAGILRAHLD